MAENKMEAVDFWIRFFKEHTNTIGCVELDGLDCREVLALLQELADKKVDKPNKMAEVAAMFGKKLGEEFSVKYQISKYKWCIEYHLAFTDKGITHYGKSKDIILRQLLTGKAVIVDD
jgi:hypothetical protein